MFPALLKPRLKNSSISITENGELRILLSLSPLPILHFQLLLRGQTLSRVFRSHFFNIGHDNRRKQHPDADYHQKCRDRPGENHYEVGAIELNSAAKVDFADRTEDEPLYQCRHIKSLLDKEVSEYAGPNHEHNIAWNLRPFIFLPKE